MLMSRIFGQTTREDPAGAATASHALMLRAGMIHQLGAGIYSHLPLAFRAMEKIETIVAEEMDRVEGQRVALPVVHPAQVWKRSGRWQSVGSEMVRFKDREDHDMVLAMTHEEVVADIASKHVHSYRDLPFMIYQIHTKFRDEPRSRAGLIRVREFVMKDAYSCHASEEDLISYYGRMKEAYVRIYQRCGIRPLVVLSSTGMMGGSGAHEFMLVTSSGEDTILSCPSCNYAANREIATYQAPVPDSSEELPLEEVSTPEQKTIEDVAGFLGVRTEQTLKAVFYTIDGKVILVAIRGDREVNEAKLQTLLNVSELVPSNELDLQDAGLIPGYASPIGITGVRLVVDHSVVASRNLVAGANRVGYHLRNTNCDRDFSDFEVADVAIVRHGDPCPECGEALEEVRGIEMGNIFQLGTGYAEKLDATYLDHEGRQQPVIMASYGIGIGRLFACVIENSHDDKGIIFPASISPYDIHIVQLGNKPEVVRTAELIHSELDSAGLSVLRDDRADTAGVKFNDADLIGISIRVTVGDRKLRNGEIEIKLRGQQESMDVAIKDAAVQIANLHTGLLSRLMPNGSADHSSEYRA
jgi:prolyl-tRNA synthetase